MFLRTIAAASAPGWLPAAGTDWPDAAAQRGGGGEAAAATALGHELIGLPRADDTVYTAVHGKADGWAAQRGGVVLAGSQSTLGALAALEELLPSPGRRRRRRRRRAESSSAAAVSPVVRVVHVDCRPR